MDKLKNLVDAFHALGIRSVHISTNLVHIEVDTDAQVQLLARQLIVTARPASMDNKHWLAVHARLDGMQVMVMGPEHETSSAKTEAA